MDGEDGEDGDGEEAVAANDDTPAIINRINNRSFLCEGGEDGAESAVATVSCQPGNGADGGDEDDENYATGPPRRG